MVIYSRSARYDINPGVAKFGIALDWGSRGRRFKSCHSDHRNPQSITIMGCGFFVYFFHTLDCKENTLDFSKKFEESRSVENGKNQDEGKRYPFGTGGRCT